MNRSDLRPVALPGTCTLQEKVAQMARTGAEISCSSISSAPSAPAHATGIPIVCAAQAANAGCIHDFRAAAAERLGGSQQVRFDSTMLTGKKVPVRAMPENQAFRKQSVSIPQCYFLFGMGYRFFHLVEQRVEIAARKITARQNHGLDLARICDPFQRIGIQ